MANLDGTDDVFDSRDVIERIEELIVEWEQNAGDTFAGYVLTGDDYAAGLSDDAAEGLAALIEFRDQAESVSDWQYGETFISDDYFTEYTRELAEDIGAIDREASWPLNRIDWKAAADDLKMDYTSFEFMGTTYWARA